MSCLHGRLLPLLAASMPLVGMVACSVESPASTPTASAPATLFSHATVEAAWKKAAKEHRPLVIMFTSDHCPHCERMLAETYAHPATRKLLAEHSETALAHAKDYQELIKKLGIRGFPTTLVVGADGQIVDAVEGFVEPREFISRVAKWVGPRAAVTAKAPSVASPR